MNGHGRKGKGGGAGMDGGPEPTRWRVGQVADMARVTVRTLHHWDAVGLLVPSDRSDADYRLYSRDDLDRLYRILLYRELGFPLDAIAGLLDDPEMDRRSALREQRELLVRKRHRTDALIQAVDRMLNTIDRGSIMSEEEMYEGFEAFADAPDDVRAHQVKYDGEARERWGDTDPYRESMRRARAYGRGDWERIRAEADAVEARMAELLDAEADPEGEEAMREAEALRLHVDRSFYPCSHEMHAALADMYESDARFAAHYEARTRGLAAFVATAIRANARRAADHARS